jgi:hypothetical protein
MVDFMLPVALLSFFYLHFLPLFFLFSFCPFPLHSLKIIEEEKKEKEKEEKRKVESGGESEWTMQQSISFFLFAILLLF